MLLPAEYRQRFLERIQVGGQDECWPWRGKSSSHGYGALTVRLAGRKITLRAHRVAYSIASGADIPPGFMVCHTCDNPPCCNPHHLFVGRSADNVADMVTKGRAPDNSLAVAARLASIDPARPIDPTRPRGERVNTARLTEDAVRDSSALPIGRVERQATGPGIRDHPQRRAPRREGPDLAPCCLAPSSTDPIF